MDRAALIAETSIIDVDTHVTEPVDLWTSRMSVDKWGDGVPQVRWDEGVGAQSWFVGGRRMSKVTSGAHAGWSEFVPSFPPTLEEADPGSWQPGPRLQRMDEYGIFAQVLYPNVLGFHTNAFLALKEPALMLECVRAYNDFLTDFASADPKRLIPITVVPFWDIDLSIAEIQRCHNNGHKGIVMPANFEKAGYPSLSSGHWDRIFAVVEDLGLPVNFHIGFAGLDPGGSTEHAEFNRRDYVTECVLFFLSNAATITDIIVSGLCDRFPRLNFVSVESGFGYIPYLLEAMDWQWKNGGAHREFPDATLPSDIFRRQVYGTFWFEKDALRSIEGLENNVMFETDYPHPTSLSPGPASYADIPTVMIERNLAEMPDDTLIKVLRSNAARIYHLG